MQNVITFHFEKHPVRIVTVNGGKYFVIRDVCNILGFSNPNRQLAVHTENVPLYERIGTPGGLQVVRLVPREDVEKILAANRGRKAAALRSWLQTKLYQQVFPDDTTEAAKAILYSFLDIMRLIMSVPLAQQPTVIFGLPDLAPRKATRHENR